MLDECLQAAANTCDLPADVLLTSLAVACINRCPQGLCCLLVSASQVADHSLLVLVAWALGPAGNQAAGNCCHSLLQHQTPRHWRLLQFQQQIGSSPLSQQAGFLQRCPCRPYLQQRTHSAVCYLQRAGADFGAGTFQFQQGSGGRAGPQDVLAAPGRVVSVRLTLCNVLMV